MTAALSAKGVRLRAEDLIDLRPAARAAADDPSLAALPGGFPTRRRGLGLEIAETRAYVPGDDIRHLDRGATARTGKLHIRQFQEERDRITLLVADFRPAMFWGLRRAFRSVAAAEALTLLGWSAVDEGGRVGLLALTPGRPFVVAPRGRVRGMLDVIGGLVEAHAAGLSDAASAEGRDPPLDAALARIDRLAPAGSEVVIASGFDASGAGLPNRLDALARRRRPRLLWVTDAESGEMPPGRYPLRLSDGRLTAVRIGRSDRAAAKPTRRIAGRPALVISASDPVSATARRLAAGFPQARPA